MTFFNIVGIRRARGRGVGRHGLWLGGGEAAKSDGQTEGQYRWRGAALLAAARSPGNQNSLSHIWCGRSWTRRRNALAERYRLNRRFVPSGASRIYQKRAGTSRRRRGGGRACARSFFCGAAHLCHRSSQAQNRTSSLASECLLNQLNQQLRGTQRGVRARRIARRNQQAHADMPLHNVLQRIMVGVPLRVARIALIGAAGGRMRAAWTNSKSFAANARQACDIWRKTSWRIGKAVMNGSRARGEKLAHPPRSDGIALNASQKRRNSEWVNAQRQRGRYLSS